MNLDESIFNKSNSNLNSSNLVGSNNFNRKMSSKKRFKKGTVSEKRAKLIYDRVKSLGPGAKNAQKKAYSRLKEIENKQK